MKIHSAGRLGNTLFIWAFAIDLSNKTKSPVTIISDDYHSLSTLENFETNKFLTDSNVRFQKSNITGAILVLADWVNSKSKYLGGKLRKICGISDEWAELGTKVRILRGYFQKSEYVQRNKTSILEKLNLALESIENESVNISKINDQYNEYQLIHIRLGDFVGSESGIVDPASYIGILEKNIPLFVCTNGSKESVLAMLDREPDGIFTADTLRTWEVLCLMKNAKIFIGVNSTLSWWGAFLSANNKNRAYLPFFWNKSDSKQTINNLHFPELQLYQNEFL